MTFFPQDVNMEPEQNGMGIFGFQMPDNFDFPEDLIQELRSSEKANPDPKETLTDSEKV